MAASPLGFLIGVSLGALGGGGSILAVPALVYVAGLAPKEATSVSLVVVGLSALVGLVPHARRHTVVWGPGLLFGAAGVGGSLVGSALNAGVDPDVLLLLFSAVMVVAAVAMWRRTRVVHGPEAGDVPLEDVVDELDDELAVEATGLLTATTARRRLDARAVVEVLVAGSVVGLMTGFFGVGGGFVIVPALVLVLRFRMPEAVGTSLLVIAVNSAVALAARGGAGNLDWGVALPFAVSAMAGVAAGSWVGHRVDATRLSRAFVVLLVGVALYTALRSVNALV
ncbi:MAG: sulfite exporter TauE/SafE family protein [Acidimicrobiales bacterium]|nr:sulfite exporter TauE/SafE family protein [Acidimicrobiales bacterium]